MAAYSLCSLLSPLRRVVGVAFVSSMEHSFPAWEFYVTSTKQTLRKSYRGSLRLFPYSSADPEGKFPVVKKIHERCSGCNVGRDAARNGSRYFRSEYNLDPTGVNFAYFQPWLQN